MKNEEKKTSKIAHKEGFTEILFGRIEIMPHKYSDYMEPNKPFLPRYPFLDYEKCCLDDVADGAGCNNNSIERHRLLMPRELAIIKKAVGSTFILTIKVFLVQKCGVQNIEKLSWPGILEHCEYWLSQNLKKQKTQVMSAFARAIAVLIDHPDWTNKQIADAAGVHEKTLSRNKKFKEAKAIYKAGNSPPKGFKTHSENGTKSIEVSSDDDI
jgi:hypothetical protein